ncbi:MAG: transposase, partial [Oscillospiraceae bacterium]|nr:transposase [Oscillospiraceae bacterium]
DAPFIRLSEYGIIAEKYIQSIKSHYDNVFVDKYVIMTNHIHLILVNKNKNISNGASGSPRPTNALIPIIVRAFKNITNNEFGFKMWQTSYHDRIIRDYDEYSRICEYIKENPTNWFKDIYCD